MAPLNGVLGAVSGVPPDGPTSFDRRRAMAVTASPVRRTSSPTPTVVRNRSWADTESSSRSDGADPTPGGSVAAWLSGDGSGSRSNSE